VLGRRRAVPLRTPRRGALPVLRPVRPGGPSPRRARPGRPAIVVDGDDGPRTPSTARAAEDLDRLVAGARELLAGDLPYERALHEYFRDLRAAHAGDTSVIWSIDNVHAAHL